VIGETAAETLTTSGDPFAAAGAATAARLGPTGESFVVAVRSLPRTKRKRALGGNPAPASECAIQQSYSAFAPSAGAAAVAAFAGFPFAFGLSDPASAWVSSPTNSMIEIGALSPRRGPSFTIRV
jgi:hypothetical protein